MKAMFLVTCGFCTMSLTFSGQSTQAWYQNSSNVCHTRERLVVE